MTRISIDDADVGDGNHYWHNGEPFTGELVETDPDGNVITLLPVVEGRVHGVEREWYSDGTLRAESFVVNGMARGLSREWHRNGRIAEEREFTDRGELVALRRWAVDGTLTESRQYPDQGPVDFRARRPGVARIDVGEATVDVEGRHLYRGAPFTGELSETDETGNVVLLIPVAGGRVHGVQRTWYQDGTIRSVERFVDGVPTGTSIVWHPTEWPAEQREYDDSGRLVALRRWAEDGTPVESKRYDTGA